MQASRLHKENVDRLARSLKQLESLVSSSYKNDDVDDKFIAFIKEWRKSREDIIDYDMVRLYPGIIFIYNFDLKLRRYVRESW